MLLSVLVVLFKPFAFHVSIRQEVETIMLNFARSLMLPFFTAVAQLVFFASSPIGFLCGAGVWVIFGCLILLYWQLTVIIFCVQAKSCFLRRCLLRLVTTTTSSNIIIDSNTKVRWHRDSRPKQTTALVMIKLSWTWRGR